MAEPEVEQAGESGPDRLYELSSEQVAQIVELVYRLMCDDLEREQSGLS